MTHSFSIGSPILRTRLLSIAIAAVLSACSTEAPAADSDINTWPSPSVDIQPWVSNASVGDVAAAALSGVYATANDASLAIEIRDIRQNLIAQLSTDDFIANVRGFSISEATRVAGMALSPSGRLLFVVLDNGEAQALVAYNMNTQALNQLPVDDLLDSTTSRVGLSYFSGALYVGYEHGVYRLELDRNGVYQQQLGRIDTIELGAEVRDITVDFDQQTLYLTATDGLYRLAHNSNTAQHIYQNTDLISASVGREYGQRSSSGLYLLTREGENTGLWRIAMDTLQSGGVVAPVKYRLTNEPWQDFTHSADGGVLFTDGQAASMHETGDGRLRFEPWLRDEFSQYMRAVKGLIASDQTGNFLSPEGFIHNGLQAHSANRLPIAENVGWVLYLLMLEDAINGDQANLPLAELIIRRHAGLHQDGLGGVRSVDGHFVRNYRENGEAHETNPQMQVYISMKFLPAVYKAAEFYSESDEITQYLKYLRQIFVRSGDVVRGEQRITWESDDFGPFRVNRKMNNETWIFGDLAAAQDPNATVNYDHYTYDRENFKVDNWLNGEPVMDAAHPAFIVFGATLILEHHYHGEGWYDLNQNYYSVTQSETDQAGFPYFAAFSAGNNLGGTNNYNADGPKNHPGDYIHFPAVLGFGQHGKLDAMVGGYQAYRNELRQKMISAGDKNIRMLTRWSRENPQNKISGLGIADFWFGAVGLAEAIKPGVTAQFRNTFHQPNPSLQMDEQGNQFVDFSKITPRQVTAIADTGERVKFGYQRSPFTLPNETLWVDFELEDPKGDWIELDDVVNPMDGKQPRFINPDFAQGLIGWAHQNGKVSVTDGVNGQALLITANGESAYSSQSVYLPIDLKGTQYQVSALVTRPDGVAAEAGQGCLQLAWQSTPNNVTEVCLSSEQSHDVLTARINKSNDNSDDHLSIRFAVTGEASYQFDNLAVQTFGAKQPFHNGGFENAPLGWYISNTDVIKVTEAPNEVISEQRSLKFALNGQLTSQWSRLERDINIANDPDGTRYIFRFKVGKRSLEGAKFDVQFRVSNPDLPGDEVAPSMDWWDAGVVTNESPDVVSVVVRKRPGETQLKLQLRLEQKDPASKAYVVIDDLEFYKQRLFDASQCTGSVTGC